MSGVAIIGAGGHGRVVASVLQAANREAAGFIDSGAPADLPLPLLGQDKDIPKLIEDGVIDSFIIGLGSVKGGASLRAKLFDGLIEQGLTPAVAIHPMAMLSHGVKIGAGSVLMAGAIINTGTSIGRNCIVNTGAIIDHDGDIKDHVHIAPGVICSGNVTVGQHSLLGVGSTVKQGVTIGANVTIGAGSVVLSDITSGATAYGNPAKIP
ncbi:acetyltransferase [Hellea balneolensis]|uniref:acetyltransferase n=1 Tax=Hellea balneolensis TaxID=287478 RepID=UPI0003F882B9|nr:acetyltransferase [Hellea balneolensis]